MADIIAFPARNASTAAPAQPRAVSPERDGAVPPLAELAARMRAQSQELTRSLDELQTAVRDLAEADLPGQARALMAAALGDSPAAERR